MPIAALVALRTAPLLFPFAAFTCSSNFIANCEKTAVCERTSKLLIDILSNLVLFTGYICIDIYRKTSATIRNVYEFVNNRLLYNTKKDVVGVWACSYEECCRLVYEDVLYVLIV